MSKALKGENNYGNHHSQQNTDQMRFLLLLLAVSYVCIADAQATVTVVSKRNPGISWECLVPVANDDTTKPELGSCMPEALCDSTGKSKWKNVFGYYHVIDLAMRIVKIFNYLLTG